MARDQELVRFLQWCLPQLGLKWSGFRKVRGTVGKRIARRLQELGLSDLDAYRIFLKENPEEWQRLDSFCVIPISRFFRDREVFRVLEQDILPDCARSALRRKDNKMRCLSAGCASGEEAYTLSIIWRECVAPQFPDLGFDLLAVDVDDVMLKRCAAGRYKASSLREIPDDLQKKAFVADNGTFAIRDEYRAGVVFEKHDLRGGVPQGPFDLILCRNVVFTYFGQALQQSIAADLDDQLWAGGFLLIGGHEVLPEGVGAYGQLKPGLPVFQKRNAGQQQ